MRKNCLVRYATLCSVKICILHGAARRHFHYALGHLWGGALTSVPDENTPDLHQQCLNLIRLRALERAHRQQNGTGQLETAGNKTEDIERVINWKELEKRGNWNENGTGRGREWTGTGHERDVNGT